MSDNLRSRIAAALRNATPLSDDLALADAVIVELGLHREVGLTWNGTTSTVSEYRYVTAWTADG